MFKSLLRIVAIILVIIAIVMLIAAFLVYAGVIAGAEIAAYTGLAFFSTWGWGTFVLASLVCYAVGYLIDGEAAVETLTNFTEGVTSFAGNIASGIGDAVGAVASGVVSSSGLLWVIGGVAAYFLLTNSDSNTATVRVKGDSNLGKPALN